MIISGVLLLLGVVVLAVGGWDNFKALFQQNNDGKVSTSLEGPGQVPTPEEILRERYARGELSREDYQEALETLST